MVQQVKDLFHRFADHASTKIKKGYVHIPDHISYLLMWPMSVAVAERQRLSL